MSDWSKKLGGANGDLVCDKCSKPRYPGSKLCPDCWGKENEGSGTRNSKGIVIQAKLRKSLWLATNFAAKMIYEGQYRTTAIRIAANYYDESYDEVQRALAQRSGRNRKGKKFKKSA